jgi:hypothetical protein
MNKIIFYIIFLIALLPEIPFAQCNISSAADLSSGSDNTVLSGDNCSFSSAGTIVHGTTAGVSGPTLTIQSGGSLTINADFEVYDNLVIESGAELIVNGDLIFEEDNLNFPTIIINGDLTVNGNVFQNEDLANVSTGVSSNLTVTGDYNLDGGFLTTDGVFSIGNDLDIDQGLLTVNGYINVGNNLDLNGTGITSIININAGGILEIENDAVIGTGAIGDNPAVLIDGGLIVRGDLTNNSGGVIDRIQSPGGTGSILVDGTFTDNGDIDPIFAGCGSSVCCGDPSLCTSLPVELISFEGAQDGDAVRLNWSTATELINFGFHIERRSFEPDAEFRDIGFVPGAGTTNERQDYEFTDYFVNDNTYYRLRQEDTDGTITYSDVIVVEVNGLNDHGIRIKAYPNPTVDRVTILCNEEEPLNAIITDGAGNVHFEGSGLEIRMLQEQVNAVLSEINYSTIVLVRLWSPNGEGVLRIVKR